MSCKCGIRTGCTATINFQRSVKSNSGRTLSIERRWYAATYSFCLRQRSVKSPLNKSRNNYIFMSLSNASNYFCESWWFRVHVQMFDGAHVALTCIVGMQVPSWPTISLWVSTWVSFYQRNLQTCISLSVRRARASMSNKATFVTPWIGTHVMETDASRAFSVHSSGKTLHIANCPVSNLSDDSPWCHSHVATAWSRNQFRLSKDGNCGRTESTRRRCII